jgi:hypothetical protein
MLVWSIGREGDGAAQRARIREAVENSGTEVAAVAAEQLVAEPRSLCPLPGVPDGTEVRLLLRVDGEMAYSSARLTELSGKGASGRWIRRLERAAGL